MKKTLLSRRGAAIELAMIVLALLMVVSIVLLTMASIQYNNLKSDISGFESKIELYEIGEYVCEHRADFGEQAEAITFDGKATDFSATKTVDDDTGNITLLITENEQTVLTIVLKDDGTIISWK